MAKRLAEVMNREVFTLRRTDRVADAIAYLLSAGLTAAPVVDPYGKPLGFLSLRDSLDGGSGRFVSDHLTAPAHSVPESASVQQAAEVLARQDLHHAAVVNEQGHLVGVVGALDLLKALVGHPVSHPAVFPHQDRVTGLTWSDDRLLDVDSADSAPDGPGLLALVSGGVGRTERIVYAESCGNVRARVRDLASRPQDSPGIERVLRTPALRYRTASAADAAERAEILGRLLDGIRGAGAGEGARA